jgi:hypothetical protein
MSQFKENFAAVHFKLETMQQFPTVFGPRFWLFKLDFKAAYHNFLVRKCLREFFGVEFDGKYYTYSALPFGFRMSAFWLNKMVKVVATFLRSQGYAVLPYMDDGIYGSHTFVRAVRYRNYVVRLWESLGLRFSPSVGKCHLTPTQSLEGLGVVAHLASLLSLRAADETLVPFLAALLETRHALAATRRHYRSPDPSRHQQKAVDPIWALYRAFQF